MQNRIKKQKIFFYTPVYTSIRISEIFNIKHLWCSKADLSKEEKKKIFRKDTLRISVAAVRRCTLKKVSLKNSPPVYWHIIKIDIK